MAKKTKKPVVGSLQPDVDSMLDWNSLTPADFAPAEQQEKEDFIQQRKSVSYWADAWRRLRKNAVAMVALGDKLSNLRSFYRAREEKGEAMWQAFHQKDPRQHHWYYRTIAGILSPLAATAAWREYDWLIRQVFEEE